MELAKEIKDPLRKKHEVWKRRKVLFRELKDTGMLKVAKKATKAIEQARKHVAYPAKNNAPKDEDGPQSHIRQP